MWTFVMFTVILIESHKLRIKDGFRNIIGESTKFVN